jgi:hypothetical protein
MARRLHSLDRMTLDLELLKCGNCEELKTGVHATALGLAVVMGLYNAAAWLRRRDAHLAINAVLYAALTVWEQQHVAHHLAELRRHRPGEPTPTLTAPITELAA